MDAERMAHWLIKDINRAIREYGMLADGDRVAVALSGGKDSFSLLRLLDFRRKLIPERYELVAIHILGDSTGPFAGPHTPMIEWLEANHYDYALVPLSLPEGEPLPLDCRRCTWTRRKALFETAQRLGCKVVAFGHHADDLAQTTLLNLLYHGKTETMLPKRSYFDGAMTVIRPLCFLPEKEIRRYARASAFPPPPPNCPRSSISRRKFVAELIRQAETGCPNARTNLLRAGLNNENSYQGG